MRADVVIGAIRSKSGKTPVLVTEQMVSDMQEGSVVIDVCIDQGGCFETSRVTSHADPVFTKLQLLTTAFLILHRVWHKQLHMR